MRKIQLPKFDTFFWQNWFFWIFIFLHFCKYFQFRTTYPSLQYLIFCIRMSVIYWIQARFNKSKIKPVVSQRTSLIFYDTHFIFDKLILCVPAVIKWVVILLCWNRNIAFLPLEKSFSCWFKIAKLVLFFLN